MHAVPLLLITLIGLSLGLLAWGMWRTRGYDSNDALVESHGDVLLLGLLVLAAFTLGVFLTYVLLGPNW